MYSRKCRHADALAPNSTFDILTLLETSSRGVPLHTYSTFAYTEVIAARLRFLGLPRGSSGYPSRKKVMDFLET
jgi:hypothetical protein